MVAYWELAAHSAYDMFSYLEYPTAHLVFPTSVFGVEIYFSVIAPFHVHFVPFHVHFVLVPFDKQNT